MRRIRYIQLLASALMMILFNSCTDLLNIYNGYDKPYEGRIPTLERKDVVESATLRLAFSYPSEDILWGDDWRNELHYDWDETLNGYGPLGYTHQDPIKGTLYNLDAGGYHYSSFFKIFDADGGDVLLSTGSRYGFLLYDFGSEYTTFYESEDKMTYEAYTRAEDGISGMGDLGENYAQPDELTGFYESYLNMTTDPSSYEEETDADGNVSYVRKYDVSMQPYSFIYLIQVVILNNEDESGKRVLGSYGMTLSGLSKGVNMFTRKTSDESVSVSAMDVKPIQSHTDIPGDGGGLVDKADIMAARIRTWGIPGITPSEVNATVRKQKLLRVGLSLRNGGKYCFDKVITKQIYEKPTGGVITVFFDAEQIPDDLMSVSVSLDKNAVTVQKGETVNLKATVVKGGNTIPVSGLFSSDNTDIADVNFYTGTVTGVSVGTTTIRATYEGVSDSCVVTVVDYGAVDLGLSVKWASFNVGASKPEEYGDYFAWGETEPKSSYYWGSYKWVGILGVTKYNYNGEKGPTDNKYILEEEDDVAHVIWGGNWRLPTRSEVEELRADCSWTWTTLNGVEGYIVTGQKPGYTDNYIFIPAAGSIYEKNVSFSGELGYYWTSSLNENDPEYAWSLYFSPVNSSTYRFYRMYGHLVRPVCP